MRTEPEAVLKVGASNKKQTVDDLAVVVLFVLSAASVFPTAD